MTLDIKFVDKLLGKSVATVKTDFHQTHPEEQRSLSLTRALW
ncbi:MAG: hypothetical protein U7123_06270 [Potamolinea sp.]